MQLHFSAKLVKQLYCASVDFFSWRAGAYNGFTLVVCMAQQSVVMERRTRGGEVASSTLADCTVVYEQSS